MSRRVCLAILILLAGCASDPATTTSVGTSTWTWTGDTRGTPPVAGKAARVVTVIEVVDGDTADVRYRNGTTDTIRLLGIDAPETHVENDPAEYEGIPDAPAGRTWLACWGERAGEFLRDRIEGERVRIVTDGRADRRGEYGRLLVYVYHEDTLLNLRLLEGGYARLYDSPFSMRDRFVAAESRSRARNRGIWGFEANRTAPRTRHADRSRCFPPSTTTRRQ